MQALLAALMFGALWPLLDLPSKSFYSGKQTFTLEASTSGTVNTCCDLNLTTTRRKTKALPLAL
jgi:hypothetical protein